MEMVTDAATAKQNGKLTVYGMLIVTVTVTAIAPGMPHAVHSGFWLPEDSACSIAPCYRGASRRRLPFAGSPASKTRRRSSRLPPPPSERSACASCRATAKHLFRRGTRRLLDGFEGHANTRLHRVRRCGCRPLRPIKIWWRGAHRGLRRSPPSHPNHCTRTAAEVGSPRRGRSSSAAQSHEGRSRRSAGRFSCPRPAWEASAPGSRPAHEYLQPPC
mmetsp:Transcript_4011/g.11675  ORF Transcript_4011/g.11675 Transcript_4011/m.11675 type:complete len:217 (+) Transcript_4011:1683-2333(+)